MDINKIRQERMSIFDKMAERALAKPAQRKPEKGKPEKIEPAQVSAKVNLQDYIQIPETGMVIAKNQTDNGLRYEPAHIQVLQRGLEVPNPYLFTTHLLNVINAKNRKTTLYDGLGAPLGNSEVEEVYQKLTGNCWVWLNAGFKKTRDEIPNEPWKAYDIETITGLDSDGNLAKKQHPLEKCLMEDCFINLTGNQFNFQGLATKSSRAKNYQQGKVIKFYFPRDNCVAGFVANLGRACLYCYRVPSRSGPSLGVFVCAREASATQ